MNSIIQIIFSDPLITSVIVGFIVVLGLGGYRAYRHSHKSLPPAPRREQITDGFEAEQPTTDSLSSLEDEPAKMAREEEKPDEPEPISSRMVRLRSKLAQSGTFGKTVLNVFGRGDLSEEDWEEIEDTLLMSDLGVNATEELMEYLRTQAKVLGTSDPSKLREALREKLLELVNPQMDRTLNLAQSGSSEDDEKQPGVVLVVGINGSGKTTSVGRLARILRAEEKQVVLGAADTFRAAAADQLETWGERVGVPVVRSEKENADPASVAFEAVDTAIKTQADVVLIDTAGRLQNKKDLMDELGKVKRVIEKRAPITETLLVLDATIGQNGMAQARVFSEVVPVTGIVLCKLDGSAKGGIVVSVQRELGVPVKLVGLGEGADDMAPFSPEDFVDELLK